MLSFYVSSLLLCGINGFVPFADGMQWWKPKDPFQGDDISWCDSGKHQSPVDIKTAALKLDTSIHVTLVDFNTTALVKCSKMIQTPGSESLAVYADDGNPQLPRVIVSRGDSTEEEYLLDNINWVWQCSEHAFDGQEFALEVHFELYNRRYGHRRLASTQKNGLFVLALLYKLVDATEKVGVEEYNKAIKQLKLFMEQRYTVTQWIDFFPSRHRLAFSLYWYDGSLTRPPCPETVTYAVFAHLSYVTQVQLDEFTGLFKIPPTNVCRKRQPLNDRRVRQVSGRQGLWKNSSTRNQASTLDWKLVFIISLTNGLGRILSLCFTAKVPNSINLIYV
jgi:carbonic anhydrase